MKFAKSLLITALALGATALTAFSQTNISLPNTQPYYSISNIVTANGGFLIANDIIAGGQTFTATSGTNNLGQQIQPVGVTKSLNVSFGFIVTTTNTAGASYVATIQAGTGLGDWTSLSPVLPLNPVATFGGATTNSVWSTNATYNVGGYTAFRVKTVTSAEAATTNATYSVSFACKPGI